MIPNVYPTPAVQAVARNALVDLGDWFDGPARVSLVEGAFDPADPVTYPAGSAAFAAVLSDTAWEVFFDAVAGNWKFVAPDPTEGWNFPAIAADVTITGYKVVCDSDPTHVIGAMTLATPIPIASIGQVITLPNVSFVIETPLAVPQVPFDLV